LDGQKDRLAAYQVQARFALATMYDRAANDEEPKKKEKKAVSEGEEQKPEEEPKQ